MTSSSQTLPVLRDDLVIRSMEEGVYVIKRPDKGSYYRLGEVEFFLLKGMDGEKTSRQLREEYREAFGEKLERTDLKDFLKLVRSQGLVREESTSDPAKRDSESSKENHGFASRLKGKGSIMYYRWPLCRPDKFFTWLEPHIRWIWTKGFVLVTLGVILTALLVLLANRHALVSSFQETMRWETIALVWICVFLATCLHECAHGLTCKHYGGEVPDSGLLLLFFMPCFYCNVTDAWLIPQKSRRLAITLAGAYSDLIVWSLCVFVWRLTMPDTFINYLSLMMLSVCGMRSLLNLNPFLKLDGYYLLIDWLEMPNLRSRGEEYWKGHLRWILWGAKRPEPVERGRILIAYGIFKWVAAILFLDFMIENLFGFLQGYAVVIGWALAGLLMSYGSKRVFRGFFASDFVDMIKLRPKRTLVWCLMLIGIPALLFIIPMRRAASGQFAIRPETRVEVHNPVEGFIRVMRVSEGDTVKPGQVLVELMSPDLESSIVRKHAEIRESKANLARLQMGPRPEAVKEQREKVRRAEVWVQHATEELSRAKVALDQELLRLDLEIQQKQTEWDFSQDSLKRSYKLYQQGALSGEQYRSEWKQQTLLKAQLQQTLSLKESREMKGIREAKAELTQREQELAAARADLVLMEAGSRKEDIDAEAARLERLKEELSFLKAEQEKLVITAPSEGVVATPRLQERIGQLAPKGGLMLVLEDVSQVRVEITVPEEDLVGLQCQQSVRLKARSLPFDTVEATVEKIAPVADKKPEELHSSVTVYCHVDNPDGQLRSGMTGFAKIQRDSKPVAMILTNKVMKYLRTEFWW